MGPTGPPARNRKLADKRKKQTTIPGTTKGSHSGSRCSIAAGLFCLLFVLGGGAVHNVGMEEEHGHHPQSVQASIRGASRSDQTPFMTTTTGPARRAAVAVATHRLESSQDLSIRSTLVSLHCLCLA